MAIGRSNAVLRSVHRAAVLPERTRMTDGQLLDSFLSEADETAFEVLMRRHGPMVLGVCRRVLADPHDADDAFQVTFLVLVRKAATIRRRELLGSWLYGTAYRAALEARTARRRSRERQVHAMPEPVAPAAAHGWDDARPVLDEELSRLPDRYRVPVVLCDLQGLTRRDAARQLGVAEGTLSGRLTTARRRLALRLRRRGVVLSGAALASLLAGSSAAAGVPAPLALSTLEAVTAVTVGQAPLAGIVSAKVAALTEGVVKTMLLTKLKSLPLVVLALAWVGGAGAWLTYYAQATAPTEPPPFAAPVAQVKPAQPAPKTHGFLGVLLAEDNDNEQVTVHEVFADSPAAKAGVKEGDVLLQIGDKQVKQASTVVDTLKSTKPGDKLTLRLQRDDKEMRVTITLGTWPAKADEKTGRGDQKARGYLELVLQDGDDFAVVIAKIAPDSPAAKAGVREADILLKVAGVAAKDAKSVIERMADLKAGDRVTLRLRRGEREMDVTITAGERPRDFGQPPPPEAARLDRMPNWLAATTPPLEVLSPAVRYRPIASPAFRLETPWRAISLRSCCAFRLCSRSACSPNPPRSSAARRAAPGRRTRPGPAARSPRRALVSKFGPDTRSCMTWSRRRGFARSMSPAP
jgi:RNA polymerase sigma factor (sigma-70 family)